MSIHRLSRAVKLCIRDPSDWVNGLRGWLALGQARLLQIGSTRTWRRASMGQRVRILKRPKPNLTHTVRELVRLLDAIEELDELRERVRLAEAGRVLH